MDGTTVLSGAYNKSCTKVFSDSWTILFSKLPFLHHWGTLGFSSRWCCMTTIREPHCTWIPMFHNFESSVKFSCILNAVSVAYLTLISGQTLGMLYISSLILPVTAFPGEITKWFDCFRNRGCIINIWLTYRFFKAEGRNSTFRHQPLLRRTLSARSDELTTSR